MLPVWRSRRHGSSVCGIPAQGWKLSAIKHMAMRSYHCHGTSLPLTVAPKDNQISSTQDNAKFVFSGGDKTLFYWDVSATIPLNYLQLSPPLTMHLYDTSQTHSHMVPLGMNPLNVAKATGALILLLVNSSFRNQYS